MFGLVYGYEPRGTLWTVSEGLDFGWEVRGQFRRKAFDLGGAVSCKCWLKVEGLCIHWFCILRGSFVVGGTRAATLW